MSDNSQLSATTTLTVSGAELTGIQVSLSPASASIAKDSTQQFQAIGTYSDGSKGPIAATLVNWSVVNPTTNNPDSSVATIDANGLATGVYAGSSISADAKIVGTLKTATSGNNTGTATLTVLGSSALGCTELFSATSTVKANVDNLLCNVLGLGAIQLCGVDNPGNVTDSDPNNFARMYITLGLLFQDYVSIQVTAPSSTVFPAGQRAAFIVASEVGTVAKVDLAAGLSVATLLNGQLQETTDQGVFYTAPGGLLTFYQPSLSLPDPASALTIDLLGNRLSGATAALVSIKTTKPFDAVVLTFNSGVAGVLTDRSVYAACSNSVSQSSP